MMKALIAEDDGATRRLVKMLLGKWGYEAVSAVDGERAWEILQGRDHPRLAILDWNMPGLTGIDLCRRLRGRPDLDPVYIILLTGRGRPDEVVAGLDAGADDYIRKPFEKQELRARIRVGERCLALLSDLSDQVSRLREAQAHIRTLQGIIPICMHCHRIRQDDESWREIEAYVMEHTEARFSHGLCPSCRDVHYPELAG